MVRPVLAEARNAAEDQARARLTEALPAEAPALERPWHEVLDHHIGAADERQEQVATALALEVEGDALLAGVHPGVARAHAAHDRVPVPDQVTRPGALDLDDASPHLAEQSRRKGAGHALGEVDDGDAVEPGRHHAPPFPSAVAQDARFFTRIVRSPSTTGVPPSFHPVNR